MGNNVEIDEFTIYVETSEPLYNGNAEIDKLTIRRWPSIKKLNGRYAPCGEGK